MWIWEELLASLTKDDKELEKTPPLTLKVLVATIDALGHFETG